MILESPTAFKEMSKFQGFRGPKHIQLRQKFGYKKFKNEKVNDNLTLVYLEKSGFV
jgi:hypothetical protein